MIIPLLLSDVPLRRREKRTVQNCHSGEYGRVSHTCGGAQEEHLITASTLMFEPNRRQRGIIRILRLITLHMRSNFAIQDHEVGHLINASCVYVSVLGSMAEECVGLVCETKASCVLR